MIETLSFEMDETTYAALKAELSVETPFFTGKVSPKLPRLINQWVTEEKRPRECRKPAASRRQTGRGPGKFVPVGDAGTPGKKAASLGVDGRLPEKAPARIPRLINQWPLEEKDNRAHLNDRYIARRHERISCKMRIEYEISSGKHIDFVRNISRSGVYLETRKGLAVGEPVILMIPLLKSREIIRVRGAVVRKDETGVGIVFKEILAE